MKVKLQDLIDDATAGGQAILEMDAEGRLIMNRDGLAMIRQTAREASQASAKNRGSRTYVEWQVYQDGTCAQVAPWVEVATIPIYSARIDARILEDE